MRADVVAKQKPTPPTAAGSVRGIADQFARAHRALDLAEKKGIESTLPGAVALVRGRVFGLPDDRVVLASGKVGQQFFVVHGNKKDPGGTLELMLGSAIDLKPVKFENATAVGADSHTSVTQIETKRGIFRFGDIGSDEPGANRYHSFGTKRDSRIVRFS